jgi:MFS family permease
MIMGVSNLILMPLAMSIGRRPVYLFSCALLVISGIGAAFVQTYNQQLAVRMIIGIAAGQSEALVPMMIQEIHFLHERSTFLMWQSVSTSKSVESARIVQQALQALHSASLTVY